MNVLKADETELRPLPAGWQWVRLGEVCELAYGESLPTHSRVTGEVPVYGSNGIIGWHSQAVTNGPAVVIGRKGSIGEVHYSPVPCWPIDTTYYVDQPKVECDLVWLAFWLRALKLTELNKAAAIPGLNRGDAYALELPLPPVNEQQRIAASLGERLTAVERARSATEAQLEAATALPAGYLREVFDSPESRQWPRRPLGDIVENFDGKRIPVKLEERHGRKGPYPYYGASGIIDYVDDYLFDGNYILIAEDGANLVLRSTPVAFTASGKFWVNNHAHVVRPKEGLPMDYLVNFLAITDLKTYVTGAAQPKLTQADMNRIPVPVPTPSELHRVTAMLNEQVNLAEQVATLLQDQLDMINKLPAALLRRAFSGEL